MSVKNKYSRLTLSFVSIAIAPLSITAITTPSSAQKIFAQRVNCNKAVSTPELKYCSQLSYEAADRRLNEVYKTVTSNLINEQRQILISAQQAWIKFRDNNCNFETYGSRGGTGYEIFRNGCLERLTKQRTKDLQDFLSR
ncbi:lysozyme inhibitor LprI family protein [Scytonema sp. NUACC26]|uniref:lysozyme inhibitor LprI family protein n=1 Tax=Scytonema sp. NUACC26 TaxID=3140176 RepID=UPI0034DBF026